MSFRLARINPDQREEFLNLYNLYLYDLSPFNGDELRDDGTFDPTNTYLYLERDELHPLATFKGRFRVAELKNNAAAVRFWNKFYKDHNIRYTENEETIELERLEGKLQIVYQDFTVS